MALLGSSSEPSHRLGISLRDATALLVHEPEFALSPSETGVGVGIGGGLSEPFFCLVVVPFATETFLIHERQVELSVGGAL